MREATVLCTIKAQEKGMLAMQINCPSCGNTCEVDGVLAIGQHMICPFCSDKFVYSDIEQGNVSLIEDVSEESGHGEITVKCPHCGTEYEVDESVEGVTCQCSICNKSFVVKGIHPTEEPDSSAVADRRKPTGSNVHGRTMIFANRFKGTGSNINMSNSLSPQKGGRLKKFLALFMILGICISGVALYKWVKNEDKNEKMDDNADAQYELGLRYLKGEGVVKDMPKAVELFRKATVQGDDRAQYELGLCYLIAPAMNYCESAA